MITPEKFDIFISHSSKDKAFAWRLRADLQVYGVKVWLDEEQLGLGRPLTPEIEKAIGEAGYLGLVLSPESLKSGWVGKERNFAETKNILMLPILIEGDIPRELSDISYADFTKFTESEDDHAYHRAFHRILAQLGRRPARSGDLVIYRDGLAVGWENASWHGRWWEKSEEFVHTGKYAFSAELKAFGGAAFSFRSGIDTAPYSHLKFAINGGHQGGQKLKVYFNDRRGDGVRTPVDLDAGILKDCDVLPPKEWREVSISLADLDAQNTIIFKVNWSDLSNKMQPAFHLADVILSRAS